MIDAGAQAGLVSKPASLGGGGEVRGVSVVARYWCSLPLPAGLTTCTDVIVVSDMADWKVVYMIVRHPRKGG